MSIYYVVCLLAARSGTLVEFSELALHFEIKLPPSEEDLDVIQGYLYNRSLAREKSELENLKGLSNAFRKVSFLAGNMPQESAKEGSHQKVCILLNVNFLSLSSFAGFINKLSFYTNLAKPINNSGMISYL